MVDLLPEKNFLIHVLNVCQTSIGLSKDITYAHLFSIVHSLPQNTLTHTLEGSIDHDSESVTQHLTFLHTM